MSRFGTKLFATFLDNAWPKRPDEPLEFVTWSDVTKLFFENAGTVRSRAKMFEAMWTPAAVREVDAALTAVAEIGESVLIPISLSPAGLAEVWRRWQYAIIGSELESRAGHELNIPVPREAPAELKGTAVVLYVLGGPAKAYRKDMYTKSDLQRQKQGAKALRGVMAQIYGKPPGTSRR